MALFSNVVSVLCVAAVSALPSATPVPATTASGICSHGWLCSGTPRHCSPAQPSTYTVRITGAPGNTSSVSFDDEMTNLCDVRQGVCTWTKVAQAGNTGWFFTGSYTAGAVGSGSVYTFYTDNDLNVFAGSHLEGQGGQQGYTNNCTFALQVL